MVRHGVALLVAVSLLAGGGLALWLSDRGPRTGSARRSAAPPSETRAVPEPSAAPLPRAQAPAPPPSEPPAETDVTTESPLVVRVVGRVVGPEGQPVSGALVLASAVVHGPERGEERATTDLAGAFRIEPVRVGDARLVVRARGFAELEHALRITPGKNDAGTLLLEPAVPFRGLVRDAGGAPLAGVGVRRLSPDVAPALDADGARGTLVAATDEAGRFRTDVLGAGPWRLLFASSAHPDHVEEGSAPAGGEVELVVDLPAGRSVAGRVLELPPAGGIELWVRAAPLSRTRAFMPETALAPEPRLARCRPDGAFELAGLRPDWSYVVVARDAPRPYAGRACTRRVVLEADETAWLELVYEAETSLSFRCVDAATKSALTELEVRAGYEALLPLLDDDGRERRAFADGRVRFALPRERPAGALARLEVRAPGHAPLFLGGLDPLEGRELELGTLELEAEPR